MDGPECGRAAAGSEDVDWKEEGAEHGTFIDLRRVCRALVTRMMPGQQEYYVCNVPTPSFDPCRAIAKENFLITYLMVRKTILSLGD